MEEDMLALQKFLLDIDCLDRLSPWTGRFNLFDVLRISRTEIRHSNMLSWLLDPNENHGLGASVLTGFIQYIVSSGQTREMDVFGALLLNPYGFTVQREWHNIDILAISNDEQFAICIENKVDSGEHDNQLNRYWQTMTQAYPGYQIAYIYLTLDGEEASDAEHWIAMGYQTVLQIIEKAMEKHTIAPNAALLIENYTDTIRRHIVGDENLARICREIYAKHSRALDLIYENLPDRKSQIYDVIRQWCVEKTEAGVIALSEKSSKSHIRFHTALMDCIMPDAEEAISGWGCHSYYFYEIFNKGDSLKFQLALSSANMPEKLREASKRLISLTLPGDKRPNWQWKNVFTTKSVKISEDMTDEEICAQLDKQLEHVLHFEESLRKKYEMK